MLERTVKRTLKRMLIGQLSCCPVGDLVATILQWRSCRNLQGESLSVKLFSKPFSNLFSRLLQPSNGRGWPLNCPFYLHHYIFSRFFSKESAGKIIQHWPLNATILIGLANNINNVNGIYWSSNSLSLSLSQSRLSIAPESGVPMAPDEQQNVSE